MSGDLRQNLPKYGPRYSHKTAMQEEMARRVMNYELKPVMKVRINKDVPGLRKKRPFAARPVTKRWFRPFHSWERNGLMNWFISMNWVRFAFPIAPFFYLVYMMQPVMHGNIYYQENNNFQWESIYLKFAWNRPPPMEQNITRVA